MTRRLGDIGENIAADYLLRCSWIILERNYYSRYGEIDIIAKNGDSLVFVEVKHYHPKRWVHPLEAMTIKKQRCLLRTAHHFLQHHIEGVPDYQFDLIIVENGSIHDHIVAMSINDLLS